MGSIAKKALIQLQQHSLRTKAIIAGLTSAIDDMISQQLTGIQKLKLRRLLLKVLLGCAYLGPFGYFLHMILDKIFKGEKIPRLYLRRKTLERCES